MFQAGFIKVVVFQPLVRNQEKLSVTHYPTEVRVHQHDCYSSSQRLRPLFTVFICHSSSHMTLLSHGPSDCLQHGMKTCNSIFLFGGSRTLPPIRSGGSGKRCESIPCRFDEAIQTCFCQLANGLGLRNSTEVGRQLGFFHAIQTSLRHVQ